MSMCKHSSLCSFSKRWKMAYANSWNVCSLNCLKYNSEHQPEIFKWHVRYSRVDRFFPFWLESSFPFVFHVPYVLRLLPLCTLPWRSNTLKKDAGFVDSEGPFNPYFTIWPENRFFFDIACNKRLCQKQEEKTQFNGQICIDITRSLKKSCKVHMDGPFILAFVIE